MFLHLCYCDICVTWDVKLVYLRFYRTSTTLLYLLVQIELFSLFSLDISIILSHPGMCYCQVLQRLQATRYPILPINYFKRSCPHCAPLWWLFNNEFRKLWFTFIFKNEWRKHLFITMFCFYFSLLNYYLKLELEILERSLTHRFIFYLHTHDLAPLSLLFWSQNSRPSTKRSNLWFR